MAEGDAERLIAQYDEVLYDAWLEGFEAGWNEGTTGNWPVKAILRSMFWEWRRKKAAGS